MALPEWMRGHLPPAPQPEPDDEDVRIRPCACGGEGCADCGGDGVIYP